MSHIADIKVEVTDLEILKRAAVALGGQLVVGQTTYEWFGEWVGDTPMPKGVKLSDLGKCHHAIKFPGASYEVGIVDQQDGTYRLMWDYWSSGGLVPILGEEACHLAKEYSYAKAVREYEAANFYLSEENEVEEKIDGELGWTELIVEDYA